MNKLNIFLINSYYNINLDTDNFYIIDNKVYIKISDEFITKYVSIDYLENKLNNAEQIKEIKNFIKERKEEFKNYNSFSDFEYYNNNTTKRLIFNH